MCFVEKSQRGKPETTQGILLRNSEANRERKTVKNIHMEAQDVQNVSPTFIKQSAALPRKI